MIIGRFAPTPSGPLHQGSLVTAVASYCAAKSQQGKWLVRMEDLDTPRVVKGSADNILFTLEAFGFEWDGEVLYQSQRFQVYQEIVQQWIDDRLIYACSCSRKSLMNENLRYGPSGIIYPGCCRDKKLDINKNYSLRLNLQQIGELCFNDIHYGAFKLNLRDQMGDIVIKRADGIYAYHLAVVVDDAFQQVDHIVRGADLLEVTTLHLHLNRLLEYSDARYLHLPLIKTADGKKLSKQTGARGIDPAKADDHLIAALRFLGQPVPDDIINESPENILGYAVEVWDASLIPHDKTTTLSY
jgi:glutamyl-Q tRNA(Asp) synthetase